VGVGEGIATNKRDPASKFYFRTFTLGKWPLNAVGAAIGSPESGNTILETTRVYFFFCTHI
jgi:hypothetical protein